MSIVIGRNSLPRAQFEASPLSAEVADFLTRVPWSAPGWTQSEAPWFREVSGILRRVFQEHTSLDGGGRPSRAWI